MTRVLRTPGTAKPRGVPAPRSGPHSRSVRRNPVGGARRGGRGGRVVDGTRERIFTAPLARADTEGDVDQVGTVDSAMTGSAPSAPRWPGRHRRLRDRARSPARPGARPNGPLPCAPDRQRVRRASHPNSAAGRRRYGSVIDHRTTAPPHHRTERSPNAGHPCRRHSTHSRKQPRPGPGGCQESFSTIWTMECRVHRDTAHQDPDRPRNIPASHCVLLPISAGRKGFLSVEVRVSGEPRALPTAIDATAYHREAVADRLAVAPDPRLAGLVSSAEGFSARCGAAWARILITDMWWASGEDGVVLVTPDQDEEQTCDDVDRQCLDGDPGPGTQHDQEQHPCMRDEFAARPVRGQVAADRAGGR